MMVVEDPLALVGKLVARAEADGRKRVTLPTEIARALLDRAAHTGRPRLSRGMQLREAGWIEVARIRREKLIAQGVPKGEALDQVAQEVYDKFAQGGSRPLAMSTVRRRIEGPPRR